MVTLNYDGACKGCPFMKLELVEGACSFTAGGTRYFTVERWSVHCEHEAYCDREEHTGSEQQRWREGKL